MPLVANTVLSGGVTGVTGGNAIIGAVLGVGGPVGGMPYPAADVTVAANTVPFQEAPLDILAALTDGGREWISRGMGEGLGYKVIGFRVGRGGYDPSSVLAPLPLGAADTELIDPMYPVVSLPPGAIARFEYPNQTAISFLCRIPAGSAIAGLGELGLYAEIITSPSDPTEVGDRRLFAHVHTPIFGKTLQHVFVARCVIQFTLG